MCRLQVKKNNPSPGTVGIERGSVSKSNPNKSEWTEDFSRVQDRMTDFRSGEITLLTQVRPSLTTTQKHI